MPLISLRHFRSPVIAAADFQALKRFEASHPELYQGVSAPKASRNVAHSMQVQMIAFNAVFDSPVHGPELRRLIEEERGHPA